MPQNKRYRVIHREVRVEEYLVWAQDERDARDAVNYGQETEEIDQYTEPLPDGSDAWEVEEAPVE